MDHILILSSLAAATGNAETARRIAAHAKACHPAAKLTLVDACAHDAEICTVAWCRTLRADTRACVILVHLFRAGRQLLTIKENTTVVNHPLKVVAVASGTDVDVYVPDKPESHGTMRAVLERADSIVCFHSDQSRALQHFDRSCSDRIVIMSQAVSLEITEVPLEPKAADAALRTPHDGGDSHDDIWASLGASEHLKLILPCGIRPVKNPDYLFKLRDTWAASSKATAAQSSHHLSATASPLLCPITVLIVGPVLDKQFFDERVRPFADDPDSITTPSSQMRIIYHAAVARPRLLRWIASADALLNTSISEGTCNSMLEAMALRTPVIARHNTGNAELLHTGAYGFLFSTESELELLIRASSASHESWHAVVEAAHEHVQAQRSLGQERRAWANILGVK